MADLRERNKRRTREELAKAALRLFDEHGFDATTVDDIAAAAGVSRSTFFRYFLSKEHAMFPHHAENLAAYRQQLDSCQGSSSPREGILAAAAAASAATIDAFRRDPDVYRLRQRVIAAAPSLRQLGLQLDRDWEEAMADAFARQLRGRRRDFQAALLAGSLMGIVAAFHRVWAAEGFRRSPTGYRAEVMAVFERGVDAVVTD